MSDSDSDIITLSAQTLKALKEFHEETRRRSQGHGQADIHVQEQGESTNTDTAIHNNTFQENWQLSQFWYNDNTIEALVKVISKIRIGEDLSVCLISCPTLYGPLKNAIQGRLARIKLLEFDKRFEVYKNDFVFYDYKKPLEIPEMNRFDVIVADPPFLSQECLEKVAQTITQLADAYVILNTGSVMAEHAHTLLSLSECSFKPAHRNNLGNDFACFTNFNLDRLLIEN